MNSVISTPLPFPHQLYASRLNSSSWFDNSAVTAAAANPCLSAVSHQGLATSGRKRKADDDDIRLDDPMSASPADSPSIPSQPLPRSAKRPRSGLVGRPLALPRLLETLDGNSLRGILKTICDQHPAIGAEVTKSAPRPSVTSAFEVLKNYENILQSSFPFGGNPSSDYAYNRVRQHLFALLDALSDFTPHFLPPNETQVAQSLSYLDNATDIIHRLPDWNSFQHNLLKQNAYEEMSKAWQTVLKEAAKRAGGALLRYDGWEKKLLQHNQQAGNKLADAVDLMNHILEWAGRQTGNQAPAPGQDDRATVRQELLCGTYGTDLGIRVGTW